MKIESKRDANLPERVYSVLKSKNLTLRQASEESARLYGRSSPSFIPHNFYHALRSGVSGPRLHQLCAFSAISGYQLRDWMVLFGFDLGRILYFQTVLSRKRTILLDTALDDSNSRLPLFQDVPIGLRPTGIVPLGWLVMPSHQRLPISFHEINTQDFLYAKIGFEDALALPELLPGSIVRVNPRVPKDLLPTQKHKTSDHIFLVEHNKGLWCGRLHLSGENQFSPLSNQLPYANVAFESPRQIKILGVVEMEIRLVHSPIRAEVPSELADQWKPEPLDQHRTGLGSLLRSARIRAALSLRETSEMSRKIADLFDNEHYFVAPGSLSDYEAQDDPPRQIHKSIALCSIYGIQFDEYLRAIGVERNALGTDPIPGARAELETGDSNAIFSSPTARRDDPNVRALMAQFGNVPFFLRSGLESLSGMKRVSLRDFFWMGSHKMVLHPHLRGGLMLMVNRQKKKPVHSRSLPWLRQPLYLLLTREGEYICTCCSLEGENLVVHPYPADLQLPEPAENYRDAEIVGQVVAIARRPRLMPRSTF